MKFQTIEYTLPEWAICALMYGDYSGLSDDEIDCLERFERLQGLENVTIEVPADRERYFAHYNDLPDDYGSLGGDVIDIKIHFPVDK